jgi:hypothetical protein
MGAVEGWVVTHDGETIKTGLKSDGEAMKWLHDQHSYSIDHAVKHEGYDIVLVRSGKVEFSYKRDILGKSSEKQRGGRMGEHTAAQIALDFVWDGLGAYEFLDDPALFEFAEVLEAKGSPLPTGAESGALVIVALPIDAQTLDKIVDLAGSYGGSLAGIVSAPAGAPQISRRKSGR